MKRLIPSLLVAAALGAPGAASASDVVLKVDRGSHLAAVTRSVTAVALVHTSTNLHVGQRIAMHTRALRNGTLAASGVHVVGRTKRVKFRALVIARSHGRLVVSAGGAVIALRPHGGRHRRSAGRGAGNG